MVFNEKMDSILNDILSTSKNLTKKKMFGGTGYLINGIMVAGINKDNYILRLGEKNANSAIKSLNAKLFDITGRPMKGWVMVKEVALSKEDLGIWVEKAKKFVQTLPIK